MIIYDTSVSAYNTFVGTATQQATSVVSLTDQTCYENDGACFSVYGFEYKPGKYPFSLSIIYIQTNAKAGFDTGVSIVAICVVC